LWLISTNLREHILLSSQLSHLFFCEILFIVWISFEGQRIKWKLGVLFMVDVFFTIIPIGELCCIRASLLHWCIILFNWSFLFLLRCYFKVLKYSLICSCCVHWMRVNDFMFFFYVESILLLKNLCVFKLFIVFFLVVSYQTFRIRVSNKSISTSISSLLSITALERLYIKINYNNPVKKYNCQWKILRYKFNLEGFNKCDLKI
jgi:hypothetical protein